MYLSKTLKISEEEFILLCEQHGYCMSFTNHALRYLYTQGADWVLSEDGDENLESSDIMQGLMKGLYEYTFDQLDEIYGELVDPLIPKEPFYRYHTALVLAICKKDGLDVVCLFNNPDRHGEDTYLVDHYKV